LAIGEASYGPNHPTVAIDLNNLAGLLQDSKRLTEAEPLMRRHLAIFINFERKTGRPHRHRDTGVRHYSDLLAAMGKSEAEVEAAFASLMAEGGARDPQ